MSALQVALALNAAPKILSGDIRGRFREVFSIGIEQRDGHGDQSVITIRHSEVQADEAVSIIVEKATDLHGVGAARGDHNFGQAKSFRGDSAQPTIAEGGATDSPVLNGCIRRTTGGDA